MKRSCVIIPPPPPKPTTPSKQVYGTKPANEDFQGNTFNSNDTQHYFMRVFSSNCLYWDENSENWINRGCKASVQQCVLVVFNAAAAVVVVVVVVIVVDLDDEDDEDDDGDDDDDDDGDGIIVVFIVFVFVVLLMLFSLGRTFAT